MINGELIEKYQRMTDAEKVSEMKKAIHLDMPPLNLLFAVMLILEPHRVEEIFQRMKDKI